MSGSVADKISNAKSAKVNGDVVEAPKVNFFSSLSGLLIPSEQLSFFCDIYLIYLYLGCLIYANTCKCDVKNNLKTVIVCYY